MALACGAKVIAASVFSALSLSVPGGIHPEPKTAHAAADTLWEDAFSAAVRDRIAEQMGVGPERVRVAFSGRRAGLSGQTPDSLSLAAGEGGRWIVTSWMGGSVARGVVRVGLVVETGVAARDLARGHVVGPEDVTPTEHVHWGEVPASIDPVGLVTERRVRVGEVLIDPVVRPPVLVAAGERVEAVWMGSGVELRVRAEALGSGRKGGRVHVRLESGLRMEATAVSEGLVYLVGGGS